MLTNKELPTLIFTSRFKEGRRVDFKLDLLKLKSEKLEKVGEWSGLNSLVITDKYAFTEGRPPNITLKVLSRIEEPFVMFRKVSLPPVSGLLITINVILTLT